MTENDKENENQEVLLTEDEVWSIIEFARGLSAVAANGVYLTPDLVSSRMKDVTLNPMQATETMLSEAMISPKEYETRLQEFSQSFELSSMVYKRLLTYLANMLSFDITYTSDADIEKDEYNTPKYKKDLKAIETFLDRFNYRQEFRIVIRELLRNDAYFGCFRETKGGYVLQELPSEYCKITGRWNNGFLFSFNMYWFMQPGVDIDMYPDFFKKKFKEIFDDPNTVRKYNPALLPEARGGSSWIYWVDIPTTFGVCFKLTPELATRLPYFTPLFNDLVLQSLMRNLQKSICMAQASKIVMGEVPLLNKESKATVRDSIAISPDLLGKFMALVKSAISSAINVASAPLTNIRGIEFEGDNEVYDKYLRTALASSGVNTNLIFSSNIKPNVIETQLSLNVDEQLMTALYDQFNEFMNYYANRYTKTFKFQFAFEGTEFFLSRSNRMDAVMGLFDKGIILPQKIAAAMGMKPSQLRKQMEEARAFGFLQSLTVPSFEQQKEIQRINQENAKDMQEITQEGELEKIATTPKTAKTGEAKKGRPEKKDSEISDEGAATRGGGRNVGRGGKA